MCGIAGFYSPSHRGGAPNRRDLHATGVAMHEALAHRGPDDADIWQDPDLPLVLAHRRLSVIDLSAEGRQPMESASKRYQIVFNGEIYNHLDLKRELISLGHEFRGRSDTEVMLAAFECWGLNQGLQKLNGMFAFSLWDRKLRTLSLARDRFGKKPLYVGLSGPSLIFASELKAFHAHPDFVPLVQPDILHLYMRYAYVPAPYCIYKDVYTLLPGHALTLDLGGVLLDQNLPAKMTPYWFAPRVAADARARPHSGSTQGQIDEFEDLLSACVRERMISDVPLGAFLSGGIDSSTITALMQKQAARPVKTFSVGFAEQGFDESAYAAKIAAHLGTDHHEIHVSGEKAREVVPQLAQIYDEPFADASQIPTWLICAFAKEQVTVALSGDGGDEMLGGYMRHTVVPRLFAKAKWIPRPLRTLAGRAALATDGHFSGLRTRDPHFAGRLRKVYALLGASDHQDIYRYAVGQWNTPGDLVCGGSEPSIPLTDPAWHIPNLNLAENLMLDDVISYLPNDILVKVDRASMAHALEVRAPLLDPRLFEFAWRLPLNVKIRGNEGKWLLRQVLRRHVPIEMFARPKQGFTVPLAAWLRGPLRDWAESLLDARRLKDEGYLKPELIRQAWQAHLAGRNGQEGLLWTVLMFQAWHEHWMR